MKVAVFFDYANIHAASKELHCKVDYGALLEYLADDMEQRSLQVAYAYVPIDPRQEHAMDETIARLWKQGYIVKSKVGFIVGDTYKCDFDVEMTLDMTRVALEMDPDIVILVSGDRDFIPIVLYMRDKGIRVEVASFDNSMSKQMSYKCSGYISLDTLIHVQNDTEEDDDTVEEMSYYTANIEVKEEE